MTPSGLQSHVVDMNQNKPEPRHSFLFSLLTQDNNRESSRMDQYKINFQREGQGRADGQNAAWWKVVDSTIATRLNDYF